MFGHLADFRQLSPIEAQSEQVIQRKTHGTFQSRRRGESGPQRHIAPKSHIKSRNLRSAFFHLFDHPVNIAGPLLSRFFAGHIQVYRLIVIDRVEMAYLTAIGFNSHIDRLVDGSGHHKAHVIIGVFADQIDPARRRIQRSSLAKMLFEFFLQFCLHVVSFMIFIRLIDNYMSIVRPLFRLINIVGILHPAQKQALGRRRRSGQSAIAAFDHPAKILPGEFAPTHIQQRSHNRPHHVP